MNQNWVESTYGRLSIKIANFVLFRYETWPPQTILVSDWLSYKQIFSSENDWPNEANLLMKHLWKIFYKDYSFRPDPFTNMVVTGN